MRLEEIKKECIDSLKACGTAKELEEIRTKFIGRKGLLNDVLKSIGSLPSSEKKTVGASANILKKEIAVLIEKKAISILSGEETKKDEGFDVTLPGTYQNLGTKHPLTQALERISEIFISLGFSVAEGPEIETEFYNFEALNIPLDHPSRDAFDTFYVDDEHLLRSHTSNVQVHIMQNKKPPVQVIMPGRVYRPDAVDATHSFMFHQVEGLMVDEGIKFSDLKGVLELFCRVMFGGETKIRLRPHFFPFTEPSVEVDISCFKCKGKGCRICSGNGWIEIMGAGMVNPKVFRSVGYNSEEVTGFAFGMGVERVAMLLYGIDDIRLFYENDIRFLRQFK